MNVLCIFIGFIAGFLLASAGLNSYYRNKYIRMQTAGTEAALREQFEENLRRYLQTLN